MTDENSAEDFDAEFEAGWGDGPDDNESIEAEARHTSEDDDLIEPEGKQDADEPKDIQPEKVEPSEVDQLRAQLEAEQQRYRSAQGRFDKFASDMDAMRQNMEALQSKLSTTDKPADEAKAPDQDDDSEYRNPDFAKEYDEQLDAELAKRTKRAVDKAMAHVDQAIKPIQESFTKGEADRRAREEQAAAEQFENALRSKVDGYDELWNSPSVDQDIDTFINAQSPALKRAYQLAVDQGTVEEVADMLNAFKAYRSEGDAGEENKNVKPQQRENELKRKADAATAVPSRRSAIPRDSNSNASKDDLDAGWNLEQSE